MTNIVDPTEVQDVRFFKSTRSNNATGCVEVGFKDSVYVRDTKDHGNGPVLRFTQAEWDVFVGGIRDGEFDLST